VASLTAPHTPTKRTNATNSTATNHVLAPTTSLAPRAVTRVSTPGYSVTCANRTTRTTPVRTVRSRSESGVVDAVSVVIAS
jgi:hypothetical protein